MALPPELQTILAGTRLKHYPRGQIILYEDDTPAEIFLIRNGAVKIYDIDIHGNEKILHILKPPSLLPFGVYTDKKTPSSWFYASLTDCELYILPQEKLRRIMVEDSTITLSLLDDFSSNVHELLVRLSSLEKTGAYDKIIAALKFLRACHSHERRNGWWRVVFPVNHQLLADIAGVTRESASMVMKRLQQQKVIRNPRLTVLEIDNEKLRQHKSLRSKQ